MADAPPRRRGRPPLSDDVSAVSVHLRLLPSDYDALYRAARRDRLSVPELIRRALHAHDLATQRTAELEAALARQRQWTQAATARAQQLEAATRAAWTVAAQTLERRDADPPRRRRSVKNVAASELRGSA